MKVKEKEVGILKHLIVFVSWGETQQQPSLKARRQTRSSEIPAAKGMGLYVLLV